MTVPLGLACARTETRTRTPRRSSRSLPARYNDFVPMITLPAVQPLVFAARERRQPTECSAARGAINRRLLFRTGSMTDDAAEGGGRAGTGGCHRTADGSARALGNPWVLQTPRERMERCGAGRRELSAVAAYCDEEIALICTECNHAATVSVHLVPAEQERCTAQVAYALARLLTMRMALQCWVQNAMR